MLAVKTPVFEGSLDLLLHLIESEDLDITAVSLIQVTDQYLAALRAADQIDLRALADFVAVGAKLIYLKSRALLPRTAAERAADEEEVEAIAVDLTAQLEEYRQYKQSAGFLRELEEARAGRVLADRPHRAPAGRRRRDGLPRARRLHAGGDVRA